MLFSSTSVLLPVSCLLHATISSAMPAASFPFGLHTVTYEVDEDADPSAATKFSGISVAPPKDSAESKGNPLLTTSPQDTSLWFLDNSNNLVSTNSTQPTTLYLSDVPANSTDAALAGYYRVLQQHGTQSTAQFQLDEQDADMPADVTSLAFLQRTDKQVLFGSFVVCERDNQMSLLWRGSSKAVWKAPAGCALTKLGVDFAE